MAVVARVTLASIAEAVGVSVSTVSNAFNRPDQLSEALRDRILEAARALGYGGPDPVARTLRRGRVGAIGIIFDPPLSYAFTDPAAVLTLEGVAGACEQAGAGLVLVPRSGDDEGALVRSALVDGFIAYCGTDDDPRIAAIEDRGVPYVRVDASRADLPWVGIDDRGAARAAAEHLLGLGHRRLSILTLPLRPDGREGRVDGEREALAASFVTAERLAGYREAIEAAGLAWRDVVVEERQPNGFDAGFRGAGSVLDRAPRPTGILAMSDELALGALEAARQRGVDVPRELSVIGFDDTPPASRAHPALTTIHQPHGEKGAVAARLLLAPDSGPTQVELPTRLVVRASTGPATPTKEP